MNYYPRYPGDYLRDTAHLSLVEHGVYTILLDHYYSREQPLPAELEQLTRIARATLEHEQAAVRSVVEEFFPVSGDGLRHNARADFEIRKRNDFMAEQARKGKLGGRPPKNPDESREKPAGSAGLKPEESRGVSREKAGGKAERKPDESPPSPSPSPSPSPKPSAEGVLVEDSSDARPQKRTLPYRQREFHDQVVAAYHDALPELPRVKDWSGRRQAKLNARIAERLKAKKPADQITYWRELLTKVAKSDFLTGRRGDWRCPGLEWILEPRNFTKVIEGAYDNVASNGAHRVAAR